MSLINDALKRASQVEKNRPARAPSPSGMQPAPTARKSVVSVFLIATVLLALLLAGWFFWLWWTMRHDLGGSPAANVSSPPPPTIRAVAPPVVTPKPAPAAPAAPVAVAKPAPPAVAPAAPRAVAPPEVPAVSNYSPSPWPVDLKLNAIFFNKSDPHAIINGNTYAVGDDIQGVALVKIEKDKVTLIWNGHSRVLTLEGQ